MIPHVHAKVVASSPDPLDDLVPVPLNTPGELVVSGYPLQKGYWQNDEETGKVMRRDRDGKLWLWTGDIVKMDDQGASFGLTAAFGWVDQ